MELSELTVKRVITSHKLYHDAGAGAHRKSRPSTGIFLRLEGETEYCFEGQRVLSNLAHPVLLPKGSAYQWRCLEQGQCLNIEFDTDFTLSHPIGFSLSDPTKLQVLLQRLELLCLQHPLHWQLEARALVYECLHLLLCARDAQRVYLPNERLQRIQPALDFLHTNYDKPLSNDQLAALTSLSTVYFRKLFTAALGISPIQYLHRLRIEKAKELLQSDYGTLSDVATSVGYPNVFHFSKMFKGITGLSPGAYARQK